MPQNPLELLKSVAMRRVPKLTPTESENRDLRAKAIQGEESPISWRSIGRNAFDALTQGVAGDPFSENSGEASMGGKLGMLAAAAPFGVPKKLPMISPEAYKDVKAGGLRLYSRLTDAFAKAPGAMKPAKAIDIAKQGASREEISLRKLGEFLKAKQPMVDIPRDEIMGHLAANPLELDVVRKGGKYDLDMAIEAGQNAQVARDQFVHELENRYGAAWRGPASTQDALGNDINTPIIDPDEWARYQELEAALGQTQHTVETAGMDNPRYDWLQTPGPKENYGESLINLPLKGQAAIDKAEGLDINFPELNTFQSTHWDEPNNLVWSRHNDRSLSPQQPRAGDLTPEFIPTTDSDPVSSGPPSGPKGRFIEEIQSDWHQQGRERGYKGDPLPSHEVFQDQGNGRYGIDSDFFPASLSSFANTPEKSRELFRQGVEAARVPDAPFKDTYHELALKQQLLDAADDPSLEWLGVADADTVSAMEGHSSVRPGTELYYNQKHPSSLKKLLEPLGGDVGYDTINNYDPGTGLTWEKTYNEAPLTLNATGYAQPEPVVSVVGTRNVPLEQVTHDMTQGIRTGIQSRIAAGGQIPGQGMWKANLSPELKALIKERGFPAMAALLALQSQRDKFNNGNQ